MDLAIGWADPTMFYALVLSYMQACGAGAAIQITSVK